MNTQISSASTSSSMPSAIVNNIDASDFKNVEFKTLPSATQNVATLKPLAVFDKAEEIKAIVAAADLLKEEHINYERQYVEGGRKALYALLSKIYAIAIQINNSDYTDSILKELRTRLTLRGIKTQKNSHAISYIVKWVVGVNRQTAHNYSKALQAAFNDNISAQELSEYFVKRGGLQAAKSEGRKKENLEKGVKKIAMERFLSNADSNHAAYKDTKIQWTEEIFGDWADKMIIVGFSDGAGMSALRAFYLSSSAYDKLCWILSDELFKNMSERQAVGFIKKEGEEKFKIAQQSK